MGGGGGEGHILGGMDGWMVKNEFEVASGFMQLYV